jgi:hypothetical protein
MLIEKYDGRIDGKRREARRDIKPQGEHVHTENPA